MTCFVASPDQMRRVCHKITRALGSGNLPGSSRFRSLFRVPAEEFNFFYLFFSHQKTVLLSIFNTDSLNQSY